MGNIFSILSIVLLVYVSWKYRKEMKATYKKLTVTQLLGIILSYVVAIFIAFLFIYYGGNWAVSYITFEWLRTVAFIIIAITALSFCSKVLNTVVRKISNGVLGV